MSEYISVCGKCGENYKCGDKDRHECKDISQHTPTTEELSVQIEFLANVISDMNERLDALERTK